jgi:hypothetical protein
MTVIDGIASFEGLRQPAKVVRIGASALLVAGPPDIVKSKKAAGRAKDLAVLGILEKALERSRGSPERQGWQLSNEKVDPALRDQVRKLLALPPEKRTNFLRKKIGIRMSCL